MEETMSGGRVLIVDDEAVIRDSLSALLSQKEFLPTAVENGDLAIERVKQEDWDILLLDLKMPGMDGIEVLKQVKQIKPRSAVLIVTAYATVDTAVTAMKEGADDYIVKPFNPDEVILILEKVMAHQNLMKEHAELREKLAQTYGKKYFCPNCGHPITLGQY